MMKRTLRAREPISCYTHLAGAILSVIGTAVLVLSWLFDSDPHPIAIGSAIVFGLSLISLYCASAGYHYCPAGEKQIKVLRKLDHAMIYVLIAGSYTPMILSFMDAPKSYVMTGVMWGIALIGIAIKLCWFGAPRWLSTLLYILMGWAVMLFPGSVLSRMPKTGLILLVVGGISYTVGAIIYIFKWPNFFRRWFGFHELFHIFVLIGSLAHFLMVLFYVV